MPAAIPSGTQKVKQAEPYFISTRNVCRLDDLLEIALGAIALKYEPNAPKYTLYGAIGSIPFLQPESSKRVSEHEVRTRRIKSIFVTLLTGGIMAMDQTNLIVPLLAGFWATQSIARQVLPKEPVNQEPLVRIRYSSYRTV